MATRLSRRKMAAYCAEQLLAGNEAVMDELAAYLQESRREREAELVVRDIEAALAERGVLVADVASARELGAEARQAIKAFLTTKDIHKVQLRETIDETLIGGIRLGLPGSELDASMKRKLMTLRASKV